MAELPHQRRHLTLVRATVAVVPAEFLIRKQISQEKSSPAAGMAMVPAKHLLFKK